MIDTFACPKCGRLLRKSGSVDCPGRGECAVFQCDECLATVPMFGEPTEVALTFAVDPEGRAFDPAATEGDDLMEFSPPGGSD
jgi:hypothetical protein